MASCLLTLVSVQTVLAASARPVAAEQGMVVTAQHLATDVGVDVLKRGGNAIDAAIAIGYALAVVYPAAGNVGGGGFMTIRLADGRSTFLDFRERAPRAARRNMYLDKDGAVVKGLSTIGWLAVAVPGTVSGLEYARDKYGTMPREDLIAPAIALAADGFILDQGDVDMLTAESKALERFPDTAAIFLKQGRAYAAGDRLVQRDLAQTLRLISQGGADGFYRGPTAAALVKASRAGGGLLDMDDLASYRAHELVPVGCDYRGFHVISAPLPSSGGLALCEMLNILEGYRLSELGFGSAHALHYEIEAMRHAFADRYSLLGDDESARDASARLIDKGYAAQIRASIAPDKAGRSREIRAGVAPHEGNHTTHFSVIDKAGNAVSMTYTINDWFGAKVVAAGTGVLMNDEMDDFTPDPDAINAYGFSRGAANAIAPGKTPLSSMTPTIVTRNGEPVLVLGTPGGARIITAILQVILDVVDYGMDIQEAVDAPRLHNQWLPDETKLEPYAVSPDTRRILESMGHRFEQTPPANHVAAIMVGAPGLNRPGVAQNRYYGANDPRTGTGLARGY